MKLLHPLEEGSDNYPWEKVLKRHREIWILLHTGLPMHNYPEKCKYELGLLKACMTIMSKLGLGN